MEKYFLSKGLTKKGPYSLKELKAYRIYPDTKVWKDGLAAWTPASEIDELGDLIEVQPPSRIKPLSSFIDRRREVKFKVAIIFMVVIYLFISLVLKDGLNTLIFKFSNKELLDKASQQSETLITDAKTEGSSVPERSTSSSYLDSFLREANKGLDSLERPTPTEGFQLSKQVKETVTPVNINAELYRDYIPDLDARDPNLNIRLAEAVNSRLSEAFYGPVTIGITIISFIFAFLIINFYDNGLKEYFSQYRYLTK